MLIGITGLKRSGKDTAADHLIGQLGFQRTRFADPLKLMLIQLFYTAGLSMEETLRRIEGDLKETPDDILCGVTPRHAMQTLGTEWRDKIHRELWTTIWLRKVGPLLDAGKDVVVTDCRFHHEAAAIRSLGGHIVQIHRPNLPYTIADWHISEQEMMGIVPDITVLNNGTIEDLHINIEGAYIDLCKGN